MIVQAGIGLASQIIGLFGKSGAAKAEALKVTAQNFQRTWVDEIIVLYWFAPSVLAWFGWTTALDQQQAMSPELRSVQLGISAAVFGLNKLAGKR